MRDERERLRRHLERQIAHWCTASQRLADLDALAAPQAWRSLEQYLGQRLRAQFSEAVQSLLKDGDELRRALQLAATEGELRALTHGLRSFRGHYLRIETALDFYADAINTRTNPEIGALLRSCDVMAERSMKEVLEPLGHPVPPVLTYLDHGLGAAILKFGLRLWDPDMQSFVAAVKIVRHNLFRPTALIHEAGHQMAHVVGWNAELARALEKALRDAAPGVARTWAGWASEIAADAFAFVHTGYASVIALHDVLADEPESVFRYALDDPHPVSYLRILLGTAMCRRFFGPGFWDELQLLWQQDYPLHPDQAIYELARGSLELLPRIVEVVLARPYRAFGDRALSELVNPARVSPGALAELERTVGPALFVSRYWVWREPLRLLALTGLKTALSRELSTQAFHQQQAWMLRLGDSLAAA